VNFAAKIQKLSTKPKKYIDFWDYKPKKYIDFWDLSLPSPIRRGAGVRACNKQDRNPGNNPIRKEKKLSTKSGKVVKPSVARCTVAVENHPIKMSKQNFIFIYININLFLARNKSL